MEPRQTSAVEPNDWETVQPDDWQTVGQSPASSQMTSDAATDAWKAAVHSQMLGVSPGYAYQNRDEIDKQLHEKGGDYENDNLAGAIETGFEETPLGMLIRGKVADPFESDNALLRFVHNAVSFASDPVIVVPTIAGALADLAVPGAAAGGFVGGSALDAGLRQSLMDHYQKGDVKSFGELADRAGDALWAATKGALTAEAFIFAGDIPVPGLLAEKPLAAVAMKGMYQASAMTVTGAILDGRVPRLRDFEDSALMVVPLNLATGGLMLGKAESKQALMDVYEQTGKTPQESAETLSAQPPVKPDLPPGLRPAIKLGESFIDGDPGETHAELTERLGAKPVTMAELEANPERASEVLSSPEIHEQDVIDAAWVMWDDMLRGSHHPRLSPESNQGIEDQRLQASQGKLKSGRGFVAPDSRKFLTREQARNWMKKNEPDVHDMWTRVAGDRQDELHSEDYTEARNRVQGRNVASGEPDYSALSPELARFLASNRDELNSIKAGDTSAKYGNTVIRSLWDGPRKMLRAQAAQIAGRLRRLVPNSVDQEALTFLRDYRDDPDSLRRDIEQVRSGSNAKLKAVIPSMERALNPSPEMLKADQELTDYFTGALAVGKQLGIFDSSVDPSRYSPRMFMKATEGVEPAKGVARPRFTEKTVNAIRRDYLRVLDPLKSGDVEARTFNAFDEMSVYADRYSTAVATKLFTTELKNSELGKVGSGESVPDGWVPLSFPKPFFVPKYIADAMRPVLDPGLSSKIVKFMQASAVKSIELGLSIFHMKSLSITAMNNMSFADFTRSLKSDNSSAPFEAAERRAALYGLETTKTGTPYEAYRGLKSSSLPTGLDKIKDVPVIKQVDAFAQSLTRATFDVIQRKFKVMDFSLKESSWIAKHPEATEAEYGKAMRGIAKEVNAAYGGLNWDVLGVSKSIRDISRMFLLAPDWTFSNVMNLKYAGEGGPAGSAARAFLAKSFVTGIALTQAMSVAVSGQTSKHPTQVYMGTDKDGKEVYANWFFAGAPSDAIKLVDRVGKDGLPIGLSEFLSTKLGPVAGTGFGLAANKQYGGKPIVTRDDDAVDKTVKGTEYAAKRFVPITGQNIGEMLMDGKDHSWLEYVGAAAGVTPVHESEADGPPAKKAKSILPGRKSVTSKRKLY